MVTCKKCSSDNSVDSLFCRKCGAEIADEARVEAQQKLQELVAEGYRIFNEGRTEEARLISDAALEEDPRSTSALSLKGMCHERAGEVAEALAVYERVVELNPDSALDRIKVTHLRQTLAGRSLAEPTPTRGRAFFGAAAAVVLVVAIGIAIGASMPAESPAKKVAKLDPASNQTSGFSGTPPNSSVQTPPKGNPQTQEPKPGDEGALNNGSTRTTPPTAGGTNRFRLPDYKDNRMPLVTGEITDSGTKPVTPPDPTGLVPNIAKNSGRTGTGSDSGPDPKIDLSAGGGATTGSETKKPDFDPGLIDIRVSKPKTTLGGSQDLPDSNGVEALLKTARQQFLLGKHSQAAGSYEAALRAGAEPAGTNQRIGQAYANAGQNSQAISAFRKAIASYEAQLNGPGDHSRVQAALDACRRALKTLGG